MAILRAATGMVQLVVASKVGSLFLVLVFNIFNIKIGGEFGFEPSPHTLTHTLCHTHSLHTYLQVYRSHLNGRDSPGQAHVSGLELNYLVDGRAVIGLRKWGGGW